MTEQQKEELLSQTKADMERWGERPIHWNMDIATVTSLCGALQVALRHPDFATSPTAHLVRGIIFNFIDAVPGNFPALKRTLSLGFHSRFDVPRTIPANDTSNRFSVGVDGDGLIRIVNFLQLRGPLTADQALNLAAWLSVLADPSGEEFKRLREEIENS